MEVLLLYNQPVTVSGITISGGVDVGGGVMPAAAIEVWGGPNRNKLSRLGITRPAQPDTVLPTFLRSYDCRFTPIKVSCLKIIAVPVTRLPAWHPFKGKPGWFFTDEIFVN